VKHLWHILRPHVWRYWLDLRCSLFVTADAEPDSKEDLMHTKLMRHAPHENTLWYQKLVFRKRCFFKYNGYTTECNRQIAG
jgi:hypothetical protein